MEMSWGLVNAEEMLTFLCNQCNNLSTGVRRQHQHHQPPQPQHNSNIETSAQDVIEIVAMATSITVQTTTSSEGTDDVLNDDASTTAALVSVSLTTWAGLITVLLLVLTALGNTLVCIAITWDKRLQNMTNYFLMSLAVTDFMVALLVMPFGILVVIKGTFPLSPIYCVTWITLDVLFCTCSILHLCTLSVDRYLSLRYPIKYGRNKTKRRVVLKICLVWMTSVAMSVPLSLMYSRDDKQVIKDGVCAIQDPLYMTIGSIISFYIPLMIMVVTHALTMRLLKEAENSKTFTLITKECESARGSCAQGTGARHSASGAPSSASGGGGGGSSTDSPYSFRQTSFYWKRLLSKTYSNVSTSTEADTSDTLSVLELQRLAATPDDTSQKNRHLQQQQQHRPRVSETPMITNTSVAPNGGSGGGQSQLMPPPSMGKRNDEKSDRRISTETAMTKDNNEDSSSEEVWVEVAIDPSGKTSTISLKPIAFGQNHAPTTTTSSSSEVNSKPICELANVAARYSFCCGVGVVAEADIPTPPVVVAAAAAAAITTTTLPYNGHRIDAAGRLPPPTADTYSGRGRSNSNKGGWQESVSPPRMSQSSDESPRLCELTLPMSTSSPRTTSIRRSTTRQGRYIQSERKATKVLGIIFFTFVFLWTPFFSLNIVSGLCPSCTANVSTTVSSVVLWLGYASSTVNPLFYTIFNPTFRQTFGRILTFQYK